LTVTVAVQIMMLSTI